MASLTYTAITSLDGYVADRAGAFDWSVPDAEVHAFVNDLERPVGTYLYGRRLYDVMAAWETMAAGPAPAAGDGVDPVHDYAEIWRAADKVVHSRSLDEVRSERTVLRRELDASEVRRLKESSERDLSIGGATLAGQALALGVVDEVRLLVSPVLVGGGTPCFPGDLRVDLSLLEERRFTNGVVYLRYRVAADDEQPGRSPTGR